MKHIYALSVVLAGSLLVVSAAATGTANPPAAAPGSYDPANLPVIVRTPAMQLSYDLAGVAPQDLARVELWYAHDADGVWQLYGYDEDRRSPMFFRPPGEGTYRLLIVAVDRWGRRSTQRGTPGTRVATGQTAPGTAESHQAGDGVLGQVKVFVDYTPPRLYLYSPRSDVPDYRDRQLRIRWAGSDDHLSAQPVRLYYQRRGRPEWTPIGGTQPADGNVLWTLPANLAGPVIIKVVLTDQAGHSDVAFSGWININPALSRSDGSLPQRPAQVAASTPGSVVPALPAPVVPVESAARPAAQSAPAPASPPATSTPPANETTPSNYTPATSPSPTDADVAPDRQSQARAHFQRGLLYSQRREWPEAVRAYEQALACDPCCVPAQINLGNAYYRLGHFARAAQAYQLALRRHGNPGTALFGLAQAQLALGQYAPARVTLDRLLAYDRRDWQAWLLRGDAAARAGDRPAALQSWRSAAQGARDDLPAVARMAQERISRLTP